MGQFPHRSRVQLTMADKDELLRAVELGLHDELPKIIARLNVQPDDERSQKAIVFAAAKGQIKCMHALIRFGAPVAAKDGKHNAMTAAAEEGHAAAVKLLCEKNADVEEKNSAGQTPMTLACKGNHMAVAKELFRHGATDSGNKAPGLTEAKNEVQLEGMIRELKKRKSDIVDPGALLHADEAVWIAMRKHMDLVSRKEKQKAAIAVIDLEAKLSHELEIAAKAKAEEKRVGEELEEKRSLLGAAQNDAVAIQKEIDEVIGTLYKLQDMFNKMAAEHKKVSDELRAAVKEKEEAEAERLRKEELLRTLRGRQVAVEGENVDLKKAGVLLSSELVKAKKELEDWLKDQRAAAQLTAQAQKILGEA